MTVGRLRISILLFFSPILLYRYSTSEVHYPQILKMNVLLYEFYLLPFWSWNYTKNFKQILIIYFKYTMLAFHNTINEIINVAFSRNIKYRDSTIKLSPSPQGMINDTWAERKVNNTCELSKSSRYPLLATRAIISCESRVVDRHCRTMRCNWIHILRGEHACSLDPKCQGWNTSMRGIEGGGWFVGN